MKNKRKTIQSRLVLLLVMVLVPVIGIQAYMYYGAFKERKAAELRSNLEIARAVAKSFDTFVKDVLRLELAVSFALTSSPRSNRVDENRILLRTREDNPELWEIFWVSPKGVVLSATGTQFLGMNLADREYFKEIVAGREYAISDLLLSRTTGKPSFTISRAIRDEKGLLIGVVTIGILPERLDKVLGVERFRGGGLAVVDSKGMLAFRYPVIDTTWEERNWLKQYPQFGDALKGKEVSATVYAPFEEKNRMVGFAPIPSIGWAASAGQREEEVTGPILAAIGRNALIGGLILVMAFFIALSVARRLANPIVMLRQYALALGRGQGRQPLPAQSVSELNDLANAFNTMDENVRVRETALHESEQRWATTLSSIGDAVIATDVTGNITFMNPVAEDLTGWTLTDASQKAVPEVFNIINEQTRQEVENPVAKVLREGMIVGLANHTVLVRKDYTEVPIDDSGAPIRDRDGKIMGVVLVFRDITGRKHAEEHIKHLASFPNLDPNPVLEVGSSSEIRFCNPAARKVLQELSMDRDDCSAFFPTDLADILKDWDKTSEFTISREIIIEDRVYDVRVHLVPEFEVARIYAHEITKRKRAEEALRENQRLLQDVINSSPSSIFLKDLDGKFITINTQLEKMLGIKREALKGKTDYDIAPKETADYWRSHDMQVMHTGLPLQIEELADLEDGHHVFLVNKFPLVNSSGQIYGVGAISHDITDRKQAEEALRKTYDELEVRVQERTLQLQEAYETLREEVDERKKTEDQLRQAQKMEAIGTLAGGIAHDFNNVLAAILGFTEMAVEDAEDRPEVVRSLENVLKSAMRARDLVKQILAFSRKTNYERSPLALTPLIKETVQLLRASIPTTIDIRLNIVTSWDHILAAPVEVQQILMNLATNASLAMQEKGGTLEVSLTDIDFTPDSPVLEPDVMPGEYVQLTVKDTGVGMNPDVMKRVFEPFFTTREVGKGTGMGLAVVFGIVKSLQGSITVESTPGVGSAFRVFLPKVQAEALREETNRVQVLGGTERILFIDDEEMLTEWGQATLERLGYTVTAANNSKEALNIFSSDPSQFDLVITDHTMPGITGVQVAREFLRIRPNIPIILCTGHSETVSADLAREAGIKEYLMKPLAKQELAQAVRRILDKKQKSL